MRGAFLLTALEVLEATVYSTVEFFGVLLTTSRGDYRALRRFSPTLRVTLAETLRDALEKKEKFYQLLHRLERDGLAKKDEGNCWKLTKKGKSKRKDLSERLYQALPVPSYEMEAGTETIIVSFDIPERERKKRDWLRAVLKRLHFSLLHQSTWIGKGVLPRAFIEDLRRTDLFPCMAIFSISKHGTITQFANTTTPNINKQKSADI